MGIRRGQKLTRFLFGESFLNQKHPENHIIVPFVVGKGNKNLGVIFSAADSVRFETKQTYIKKTVPGKSGRHRR